MRRLNKFRHWIVYLTTFFFVAASFEAKLGEVFFGPLPYVNIVIAAVIFVVAAPCSEMLADLMISWPFIRRLVLRSAFVEGYWYLKTPREGYEDPISPLHQPGIAVMTYDSEWEDFSVETIRFSPTGEMYATKSKIATIRQDGGSIKYLNHFNLTYPKPNPVDGLSSGEFSRQGGRYPIHMRAHIVVAGEGISRNQSANRIPESVVARYKKEHGAGWIKAYIDTDGQIDILGNSTKP